MCYHKLNEETTVINLTLRPTVNPLPVPNRNAVDLSGSLYMGEYFMLSMHLRQLFRKPIRTISYILMLVLLSAFFCMSLNLYNDSQYNLQLADNAYTTIAIMDLYADVGEFGNLIDDITTADDYAGYYALTVSDYDLTPIVTAPSVKKHELRARYGAFNKDNIALKKHDILPRWIIPFYSEDVIRFKVTEESNKQLDPNNVNQYITLNLTPNGFALPDGIYSGALEYAISSVFDIIDSATGSHFANDKKTEHIYASIDFSPDFFYDRHSDAINMLKHDKGSRQFIYLEPDTEYIGLIDTFYSNYGTDEFGNLLGSKKEPSSVSFTQDDFFYKYTYRYSKAIGGDSEFVSYIYTLDGHPFWLYKYDDLKADPGALKQYEQIYYSCYINSHSFGVMTTNDFSGIPAFNLGNVYMKEGRAITDEEFASGAKVCILNRELATLQNWKVGQKINFDFYEYDYFTNATSKNSVLAPRYLFTSPDRFFDSGEYEVVGIYDVRPMTGSSTISEAAISVPWNTIYIPEKSLENAPAEEDRPVTGALLTIWLENGKIEPFIERMNELGITGAKQGDYEARFTFYDQGYSRIQPSLEALSGTAELLLILSSSLLVIAALLLAFFYAQSQKQSIGTMRLLGCSKARAFAAVMLSTLIIAVTGALIGAAIGHALTASVGESIMANANQTPEEFLAFSAYLAESTQVEIEFALGADARVSLLTCLAALGLFIVGTLVFVIRYLGKGPRELLPRAGE